MYYVNRDSFIEKYAWKSVSLHRVCGDYFTLDEDTCNINNHRIYLDNEYQGTIILSFYVGLVAVNKKGQICYYINKGH